MRRSSLIAALVPLAIGAGTLVLGCGGDEIAAPSTSPAPSLPTPRPDLRIVAITDLQGYLEPCGCTSRPLGGIDRLAARVRQLSSEAPTVLVAAGDLFLAPQGHGADAATQERWRAETLAEILHELRLAAAAPGPADLREGHERLLVLRDASRAPLVAAGVTLADTPLPASTSLTAGSVRVDIVGATSLGDEPLSAVRQALAGRDHDATLTIALAVGDRRLGRDVAELPGVDLVILGGLARSDALPPRLSEGAPLLHAGRQGQGLLVVDVFRPEADGPFVDLSEWSLATRRGALEAAIADLRERLDAWRAEGRTNDALAAQRARAAALQAELETLAVPPLPPSRRGFSARYVELDPESPRDPDVRRDLQTLDRRVNDHNRTALADRRPPPVADGEASYTGSVVCATCHEAAYAWWRGHPHGHAYETLASRDKQFHLDCVGCHVTGYERPGGSTVTYLGDGGVLRDVGCENCHGPGSAHVAAPSRAAVVRDAPESLCVRCHNEEHSDRFVYDAYRASLLVPGHGRPEAP